MFSYEKCIKHFYIEEKYNIKILYIKNIVIQAYSSMNRNFQYWKSNKKHNLLNARLNNGVKPLADETLIKQSNAKKTLKLILIHY